MASEERVTSVREAIETRRSVRSYEPEPIDDHALGELINAARLAPSSLNAQPWRFKIVQDAQTKKWIASKEVTRDQAWLASAPAILVCCADLSGYARESKASATFYRMNKILVGDTIDGIDAYVAHEQSAPEVMFTKCAVNVSIAVSFMMLRAVELGLGTCWIGMFDEQQIKQRFGIGEDLRVICLLAVGKPSRSSIPKPRRKSDKEIVL